MASGHVDHGFFTTAEGISFTRLGYGAMQLAGPLVWGPPDDRQEAIRVLHAAAEAGLNHIDTADFYGPHVTNEITREALHPYEGIHITTKVGAVRNERGEWLHAYSPRQLREQVDSNLDTLGVDALDVVNLRVGGGSDGHSPVPGSLAEPFEALAQMQQNGKIRHLGLSVVDAAQVAEAQSIAPIVTVQNWFNVVHRRDEELIAHLAQQGASFTAFWPLGGRNRLQSRTLDQVARLLGTTTHIVAIAWLLHRAPNVLVIPGTSKVAHFRENLAAMAMPLPADVLSTLDGIAV